MLILLAVLLAAAVVLGYNRLVKLRNMPPVIATSPQTGSRPTAQPT